jgi:hypothetical protein
LSLGPEESIRNLNEDARAIARQGIRTDRAAMGDIPQNLKALTDNVMAFISLDVSDEAHATSVMFIGGVIKTLLVGNRVKTH